MGATYSLPSPPPYTGPVFPPSRTYDIISPHGSTLAGIYEVRENGRPLYYTNLTRAKFGINISTIHRLHANGSPGEILAACRGSGRHSTRFGVLLGDPFVAGATKLDKHGNQTLRAKEKKYWPRIKTRGTVGYLNEARVFKVGDQTYRWERTEDPHIIGSADTYWAHWALYNENEHPHQVSAVYVHILEETAGGKLHVAQLNLYAALAPEVEVMVLAVMEGIEKLRGPKGYIPPSSSGSPGGGPSSGGGGTSGGGGGCGGCGGGGCS